VNAGAPIFIPGDYFREARLEELFADPARPFEVDLGCGDGLFLEQIAAQHPERNFLGVERLIGRVNKTARRIARRRLPNARVLRLESAYTLGWLLPARSVSRLHLICPDPWPKKAHWRNRIINDAEFLPGLQRVLVPGGEFLLKSDDPGFFENALEVMTAVPAWQALEWTEEPPAYPASAFESQWLALGKTMHRTRWQWRG
jgi:tRNA (guanine-N7-)-methyltransferase